MKNIPAEKKAKEATYFCISCKAPCEKIFYIDTKQALFDIESKYGLCRKCFDDL